MDREDQVLWLGMGLVFANFFFSGQFKSLWSVFVTKPSNSSAAPSLPGGPLSPLIPSLPGIPAIPSIPGIPNIPLPIPISTTKTTGTA